jgi:UDP-N-acetylmuramoyl-tripeptide--D-alanyl-D-alanine ligase
MPFHAPIAPLVNLLSAATLNLPEALLNTVATGITTDSRQVQPGEIFVALRGENFDGHEFVATALAKGAVAAIVDVNFIPPQTNLPRLIVSDTLMAYQAIAQWWRQQLKTKVIAITGSVGKTTTKELIAAALSRYGNVWKTQANYNNEIGVPKTLLELDASHDFAVVEMGMRGAGQIALLSQIAQPDVAVITNVGTAHIGLLGSREAIAAAKCELLAEMPKTAIAVLNQDIPLLTQMAQQVWQGRTIGYGLHHAALNDSDLLGDLIDPATLKVRGQQFPLPLLGEHNALNYLAALGVAQALELDWQPLQAGLTVELPGGRAKRYDLPHNVVILDETYNAGLESMLAAIQLLAMTPGTRRIAVLGTMKELGDWSIALHEQVGAAAQACHLDQLLILADPAEAAAMATGAAPLATETLPSHAALVSRLQEIVQPGDRLLFKASRAVGLDQVVEQFRAAYG